MGFKLMDHTRRYIGRLANISLDAGLRENPTKGKAESKISDLATSYFEKVPLTTERFKNFSNHIFSQLSVEDVEALFKVYKKDFLMFGYSPQQYKDIALRE